MTSLKSAVTNAHLLAQVRAVTMTDEDKHLIDSSASCFDGRAGIPPGQSH